MLDKGQLKIAPFNIYQFTPIFCSHRRKLCASREFYAAVDGINITNRLFIRLKQYWKWTILREIWNLPRNKTMQNIYNRSTHVRINPDDQILCFYKVIREIISKFRIWNKRLYIFLNWNLELYVAFN